MASVFVEELCFVGSCQQTEELLVAFQQHVVVLKTNTVASSTKQINQ
jgi:hypothetical protein